MGEPTKINKKAALKILEESGFERDEELKSEHVQMFMKVLNGQGRLAPCEALRFYVLVYRRLICTAYCVINGGWGYGISKPKKATLIAEIAQPCLSFQSLIDQANNLPLEEKVFSGETFNKIFSEEK